ncbi:MAG: hypothetical protein ISR52_03560 [Rhodospirillales bacterium]|nr:hypothetical protein [Rhodospirillales bacterium]
MNGILSIIYPKNEIELAFLCLGILVGVAFAVSGFAENRNKQEEFKNTRLAKNLTYVIFSFGGVALFDLDYVSEEASKARVLMLYLIAFAVCSLTFIFATVLVVTFRHKSIGAGLVYLHGGYDYYTEEYLKPTGSYLNTKEFNEALLTSIKGVSRYRENKESINKEEISSAILQNIRSIVNYLSDDDPHVNVNYMISKKYENITVKEKQEINFVSSKCNFSHVLFLREYASEGRGNMRSFALGVEADENSPLLLPGAPKALKTNTI